MAARTSRFPRAGMDVIHHTLRVDVFRADGKSGDAKPRGRSVETLTFQGRMVIERGEPYVNKAGRRQIDFVVQSWVATAFSKTLGQELTYLLSESPKQPRSAIVAEQSGGDFPATFDFQVIFDARVGARTVFRRHHGRPKGRHFRQVPPTGDRRLSPVIREFEAARIAVAHPQLGPLVFVPRDCHDNDGKTVLRRPARN